MILFKKKKNEIQLKGSRIPTFSIIRNNFILNRISTLHLFENVLYTFGLSWPYDVDQHLIR